MKRRMFLKSIGCALLANMVPWHQVRASQHGLLGYLRTNWSQDPYSLGSYSYIAKGAGRRDIHRLAKPIGRTMYFAGEATHPDYNSTVHAAYESGLIAAEAIIAQGHKKVVVVGAGISGLGAAKLLSSRGINVEVFEARNRIGGRIWTEQSLGMPLDLGASWIHGIDENPIYQLAGELNLKTLVTKDSVIIRDSHGESLPLSEAPDWLEHVTEIQHSSGANLDQLNESAYWFDDDYDGEEVIFPDGYGAIFKGLQGDYQVHLQAPVEKLTYADGDVELVLGSGVKAQGDAALITVPLGVLKSGNIDFTPPLPEAKTRAISRLGMGTLDKLYLHFDQVFWDRSQTWISTPQNGLPKGHFNQWLNLYPYIGEPVIMAFNGGPPALELASLTDEQLVSAGLQTLQKAYPEL